MKIVYRLIIFLIWSASFAQTETITSPMVISNAGDTWIMNDYNLSFTLGELAIETFLQNDIIFTQGFHQEDEYAIIDITENKQVNSITIFPNPTQDELHINFETKGDYASLSIKDITGSTMSFLSDFSTNETKSIQLSQFSQGVYFIEILLKNAQKKIVYQIQKIN